MSETEIPKQTKEPPRFEDILTGREVAEFLGVTERSLAAYRIRHCELGKVKLYFRQDVAQYLSRRMDG
jgi:hypothetical protein